MNWCAFNDHANSFIEAKRKIFRALEEGDINMSNVSMIVRKMGIVTFLCFLVAKKYPSSEELKKVWINMEYDHGQK